MVTTACFKNCWKYLQCSSYIYVWRIRKFLNGCIYKSFYISLSFRHSDSSRPAGKDLISVKVVVYCTNYKVDWITVWYLLDTNSRLLLITNVRRYSGCSYYITTDWSQKDTIVQQSFWSLSVLIFRVHIPAIAVPFRLILDKVNISGKHLQIRTFIMKSN
jgi:hypothetical protein